jgi:hypothetical protein
MMSLGPNGHVQVIRQGTSATSAETYQYRVRHVVPGGKENGTPSFNTGIFRTGGSLSDSHQYLKHHFLVTNRQLTIQ